uniref:Uncharacterized protein n=1 Tax=Trichogramma kaykai TaxID=54128 RepID=A0ABD2WBQ0_9HYME
MYQLLFHIPVRQQIAIYRYYTAPSDTNEFLVRQRSVAQTGAIQFPHEDRRATENESSAKEKAAAVVRGPRDPRPISPRLLGK